MKKILYFAACGLMLSCSSTDEMELTKERFRLKEELRSVEADIASKIREIRKVEKRNEEADIILERKNDMSLKLSKDIESLECQLEEKRKRAMMPKVIEKSVGRSSNEVSPNEKRFEVETEKGFIRY